jgi:hypothetical protein
MGLAPPCCRSQCKPAVSTEETHSPAHQARCCCTPHPHPPLQPPFTPAGLPPTSTLQPTTTYTSLTSHCICTLPSTAVPRLGAAPVAAPGRGASPLCLRWWWLVVQRAAWPPPSPCLSPASGSGAWHTMLALPTGPPAGLVCGVPGSAAWACCCWRLCAKSPPAAAVPASEVPRLLSCCPCAAARSARPRLQLWGL